MRFPIGAIIVSVFAVVWTAAGARRLSRPWFGVLVMAAVAISALLIYLAGEIPPSHPAQFNVKAYNLSVSAEVVAIILAVVFLRKMNEKDLLLPVISMIVGAHFFGMVWALGSNHYWWVGGAMIVLSIMAISILSRRLWLPVTGLGNAVILWLAILWSIF